MRSLTLAAAAALALALTATPALANEPGPADEAPGEHAAAGHHGAPAVNWFSFDYGKHNDLGPPLMMAILNFMVLAGLLFAFVGPKLRKYLHTRHDTIKRDLEEGRRLRDEAANKLAEYQAKISGVDAEVEKLVGEIRKQAQDEKARILASAAAHATQVKRDADDRIAAELDRARRLLEREVVDAAIAAAQKILSTRTTTDDQRRMVDEFIGDVQQRVEAQP